MSDTVIRVENLGKKYIIGHQQQERYTALRDVITNKVKSLGSLINSKGKVENPAFEEFWALKDVSFDIKQGDRVGIIGRNGAGKSTLLKILSRITEPTTGSIKIKGRVASLLEVGTGFHPELTGRENIFLNGAILGMGKEEIKRKFDEIVAFAEVEKFLDTPVKRYSSGMYVRLAFAVAAHLEPEILIVDEVLAVGDAQFQKKCLGKMEDVSENLQKTIIFVSHNMSAIQRLCSKVILLKRGELVLFEKTENTIRYYMENEIRIASIKEWSREDRKGSSNRYVHLIKARIVDETLNTVNKIFITQEVGIEIIYEVTQDNYEFTHGLNLYNELGIHILSSHDTIKAKDKKAFSKGLYKAIAWIPKNFLAEGVITVNVALMRYSPFEVIVHEHEALAFNVVDVFDGSAARGIYDGHFPGTVRPILKWASEEISS
jgi:lipopolysaccharide transport system ATP-binding protein